MCVDVLTVFSKWKSRKTFAFDSNVCMKDGNEAILELNTNTFKFESSPIRHDLSHSLLLGEIVSAKAFK